MGRKDHSCATKLKCQSVGWLKLWSRDDLTSLQTIANEIDRARLRFNPADPPSRRLRSNYGGATADGRQVWAQPTQGRERRPEYCSVLSSMLRGTLGGAGRTSTTVSWCTRRRRRRRTNGCFGWCWQEPEEHER